MFYKLNLNILESSLFWWGIFPIKERAYMYKYVDGLWGKQVRNQWKTSRLMTKATKWHVRPAKTQISLSIRHLLGSHAILVVLSWGGSNIQGVPQSKLTKLLLHQAEETKNEKPQNVDQSGSLEAIAYQQSSKTK